jgi:prolipoprotein diacylglyceryltransferase
MMYSLATDGSGCAFRWYALLILVGILVAMVCALCALGAVDGCLLLMFLAVVILLGILVAMVCARGAVECLKWLILAASKITAVSLAQTIVTCLAMVCALGAVRCFQPRRPIREPEV